MAKRHVTDRINDINDIYSELKANPKDDVIKISGFDELEHQTLRNIVEWMRICKVGNEGWLPKKGERRYYPYYDMSSGFVFRSATNATTHAYTASASRLCLRDEKVCRDFGQKFKDIMRKIINVV